MYRQAAVLLAVTVYLTACTLYPIQDTGGYDLSNPVVIFEECPPEMECIPITPTFTPVPTPTVTPTLTPVNPIPLQQT